MRSSHFLKLNMAGEFMRICILNLDNSSSITSFREDCFSCMPNLICLSMCDTRVSNLWIAVASRSKLSSLVELWFQKWLCCNDTRSSSVSFGGNSDDQSDFGQSNSCPIVEAIVTDIDEDTYLNSGAEEALGNFFHSTM